MPEEMLELIPDKTACPDETVFRSQINDCIQQLDPREGLVLSYRLDGWGLEEIAEITGYSTTTVYNIEKNAISSLKNLIKRIQQQ